MISKEFTHWHLTPTGWVSGESKTDFNSWSKGVPSNTVLTIEYREEMKIPGSIEKSLIRLNEIEDKEVLRQLEERFPFKPYIKVYE